MPIRAPLAQREGIRAGPRGRRFRRITYCIGRNAEAAADALWDAAGNISGNSGGIAPDPNAQEKHASGLEDTTCVRAAGETRTPDLGITNASLYQLSYSG